MNAIDFLKSIYFGDRYCTKIVIDWVSNNFELHVNDISRIRDISGQWNFYTNEDIENGIVVISGVKKIIFDKLGLLPNDEIYDVYANKINDESYEFIIEACHIDNDAKAHDVIIKVIAESVYLIDPKNPNTKIVD